MQNSTVEEFLEKVYCEFEKCVLERGVGYKSKFCKNLLKLFEEYEFSKVDMLSIQKVVCGVCDQLVSKAAKEGRIWSIDFESWKGAVTGKMEENLGKWYLKQVLNHQQTPYSATQK